MLDIPEPISYEALIYLTEESHYGGRITDKRDRSTILAILKDFYNPDLVLDDSYRFSTLEDYYIP